MRNKKGITLIALVITIIVIIILAGVSINVAVNDNFFGKANDANQMNTDAIAKAEDDEREALKQNVNDFTVGDKFATKGINIYKYAVQKDNNGTLIKAKNNVTVEDDDGTDISLITSGEEIKNLVEIETGLSHFLDEHASDDEYIYFEVKTERENVEFSLNKELDGKKEYVDVLYGEVESGDKLYYHTKVSVVESGATSKVIRVKSSDLKGLKDSNQLNGLEISACSSEGEDIYKLKFEHKDVGGKNEIALPNGNDHKIDLIEDNESKKIKINDVEVGGGYTYRKNTNLSNKTSITDVQTTDNNGNIISKYGTINPINTYKSSATIINSKKSSVTDENTLKLYLVAETEDKVGDVVGEEKVEVDTKTVYMDDHVVEFYNPIQSVELSTTNIPFYDTTNGNGSKTQYNTIKFDYFPQDADIIENGFDVEFYEKNDAKNKETFEDEVGNDDDKKDPKGYFKILPFNEEEQKNNKYAWKNKSIEIEGLKEDSTNITGTYKFNVAVKIYDYGKNSKWNKAEIIPGKYNFEVHKPNGDGTTTMIDGFVHLAIDDDSRVSALEFVRDNRKTHGDNLIIKQVVPEYTVYSDISLDKSTLNNLSSLTFDLNGNTLNFANTKQLKIGEGFTFNLKSSSESYNEANNYSNKGKITFKHDSTFVNESVLKHIDEDDMYSKPEFAKFESMETWLIANGMRVNFGNRLLYNWRYGQEKLQAFRIYLDSLNYVGWNADFEASMTAIINEGTFNFENGKIQLETYEFVKALGVGGGGVVIQIADKFMEVMRKFGMTITDLSQFTANYAQLDNTGIGIDNKGHVVLGKSEQYENDGVVGTAYNPGPHPEIQIYVDTRPENNWSVLPFRAQDPNRGVSNNYGIWNSEDDSKVDMYSGFIRLTSRNNCSSWWALISVVKGFGIYNEKGTTTIHSVTQKDITKTETAWRIKILEKFVDRFFDKTVNTGNVIEQSKCPKGFFIESELHLVMKVLGGAYYYARTGAVGMPESWGEKYTTNWTNASEYYTNLYRSPADNQTKDQFYIYDAYDATPGKVDIKINKNIMGGQLSDSFKQNVYYHTMNGWNNTYGADFEFHTTWAFSRIGESMMYSFSKGDWVHQNLEVSDTIFKAIKDSFKRDSVEFKIEYLPKVNEWADETKKYFITQWEEKVVQPWNDKVVDPWNNKVVEPVREMWTEMKTYTADMIYGE